MLPAYPKRRTTGTEIVRARSARILHAEEFKRAQWKVRQHMDSAQGCGRAILNFTIVIVVC